MFHHFGSNIIAERSNCSKKSHKIVRYVLWWTRLRPDNYVTCAVSMFWIKWQAVLFTVLFTYVGLIVFTLFAPICFKYDVTNRRRVCQEHFGIVWIRRWHAKTNTSTNRDVATQHCRIRGYAYNAELQNAKCRCGIRKMPQTAQYAWKIKS